MILIVAGVVIWKVVSRPDCGPGLESVGDPAVCVGLNLESTTLRDGDPLTDLEQQVAKLNAAVTGPEFVTIVLLDDLTPNPENDSLAFKNVRHEVQGALTAAWRANHQSVAGGPTPPVKLLLASFGSNGQYESTAVRAIVDARDDQHIVAVTGFGQSLVTTRKAASDLSREHIASIAASTSGDDMNLEPGTNEYIDRFFRITPTNTDAAKAAVDYLSKRNYPDAMLVKDANEDDLYASTLGPAFATAFKDRYGGEPDTKIYKSPDVPLNDISRATYMTKRFAEMRDVICWKKPPVIYFAGRGTDLGFFLTVLAEGGACGLDTVDVMSSDDANNLLGQKLPDFTSLHVNVFYTAVATGGEWNAATPGQADNAHNYDAFLAEFTGQHFGVPADLADGYVMMAYDAVLTAATAARTNPAPVDNPKTVADAISEFDCQTPVPGVTGQIAFTQASHGNPIAKAMPIVQIMPDGTPHVEALTWTTGQPFGPGSCG
ncbi:hypothetical protein BJY24_007405 [Nocardia transvalensis]|uniref:ABC-type branched-subunit amino acid transport system substrate-binding protein n=1 Tax=Nocardia transvalensis TaxID=37333 RepID=A0A7W9PMS0_9NOCA|nr:hypothetical protein [Nocardia transvalensis]